MSALFPADTKVAPVKKRVECVYDYCGLEGELCFQVVRYVPKNFKQRQQDGSGDWKWNLEGVERVLYRLAEKAELGRTFDWNAFGRLLLDTLVAAARPDFDATPREQVYAVVLDWHHGVRQYALKPRTPESDADDAAAAERETDRIMRLSREAWRTARDNGRGSARGST